MCGQRIAPGSFASTYTASAVELLLFIITEAYVCSVSLINTYTHFLDEFLLTTEYITGVWKHNAVP